MNNKYQLPDTYKFPLLWNHHAGESVKMFFPDLPGCEFTVPHNFKITDALEKASETLAAHLHHMERDNRTIPAPTPLHKLDKEPGTGIYIIAQMAKYRNHALNKKNAQPVVTQLSILDFSNSKPNNLLEKKAAEATRLDTFKRAPQPLKINNRADTPPAYYPKTRIIPSEPIPPFIPSKGIIQLSLWKVLAIGVLILLIGGSIFTLNRYTGSYKPMENHSYQRPAATGTHNSN